MTTAYNRFVVLAGFEHTPTTTSVYIKDMIYTIRTPELQKLAARWEAEGKVKIIPPSEFVKRRAMTATARGTMETSDGPRPHHRRS